MKRCPQCLFIYPESDQHCDFDQTPLVVVADSEIDSVTRPRGNRIRLAFILIAAVIVFGIVAVYLGFKSRNKAQAATNIPVVVVEATPEAPAPSPSPSPSVSPSPSPSPSPKASPARVTTSHTTTSVDPVSTSGPGIGTRRGAKPVIVLTSGGKIEADEVWRTRDGVWYRKNGVVTLLKAGRVRAIVNK